MASHARDVVLGALLLLSFPGALALTDAVCSEPGGVGTPTRQSAPAAAGRD